MRTSASDRVCEAAEDLSSLLSTPTPLRIAGERVTLLEDAARQDKRRPTARVQ